MKSKKNILIIIFVAFLFSCKESPCDVNTSSLLQIQFYTLNKKTVVIALDTLKNIYGIGEEGSSLYKDTIINSILIPLSQNHDTCSFAINTIGVKGKKVWDTLSIVYSRHLEFISKECGYATTFEIINARISKNEFDSIKVVNSSINTAYEENIRIFL